MDLPVTRGRARALTTASHKRALSAPARQEHERGERQQVERAATALATTAPTAATSAAAASTAAGRIGAKCGADALQNPAGVRQGTEVGRW